MLQGLFLENATHRSRSAGCRRAGRPAESPWPRLGLLSKTLSAQQAAAAIRRAEQVASHVTPIAMAATAQIDGLIKVRAVTNFVVRPL